MHINSVCTGMYMCGEHPCAPTPCPPHLCVNELFLWRGQVERSQSFQPKKSIASSWIIEMFAISFFTKKKKKNPVIVRCFLPQHTLCFYLWCHDMKTYHSHTNSQLLKVFILLMTQILQYLGIFFFSPVLAVFVHIDTSHIQQLSSSSQHLAKEGTLQVRKKKDFIAEILIFPLCQVQYWCTGAQTLNQGSYVELRHH